MVKKLLADNEYEITSSTTIYFPTLSLELKNIAVIIKASTNETVYNFACEGYDGTLSGGKTLTLLNTTVTPGEELIIILMFEEGSNVEKLSSIELWSKRQEKLLAELLEAQLENNKVLKKIYNPE